MGLEGDPHGSNVLKLSWEPRTLKLPDGSYEYGRYELFEDWVEAFVARTGGWPGGPHFMTPEELDLIFTGAGWHDPLREYVIPLPEEEEYADDGRFVPAQRLIRALRRSPKRVAFYLGVNSLPRPYRASSGLVWKFDDIRELLLLAERITQVFSNNDLIREEVGSYRIVFTPGAAELSEREYRRQFIAANLGNVSDNQLKKIQDIILDGPDREADEVPKHAPRLWRDRTSAERANGPGFVSPAAFILSVYGPWLARDLLTEDDIEAKDPELAAAYRRWLYRHKRDRIEALKPGLSELERRAYSITRNTPWDEVERIALAVAKQRQRRGSKPRPS